MKFNQSTKKEYIWNTVGVFAQNAISPFLLIVIARLNGIYDTGIFSFAFSLAIIFWAIAMWGGRTYQVSDVQKEFTSGSYIAVRVVLGVIVLMGAVLFSLINHYDSTKTIVIVLLVLFKVIESFSDAIYGILQVNSKLHIVGKSLLYKAIAGLTMFILIDSLTKDIILSCVGIVIANIFIVLFYDLPKTKEAVKDVPSKRIEAGSLNEITTILKKCFPVFVVIFLAMFSLNIPRYFLDVYHPSEIGIFGIIAMPVTLVTLFMIFIMQPNILKLSTAYNNKKYTEFDYIVKRVFIFTILIGIGILAAGVTIGIPALNIIFGINFNGYEAALTAIIIGGVFSALVTVFINIFVIMRIFKAQLYILLLTNLALLLSSPSIVDQKGLLGGVVLFMVVNVVQFIIFAFSYRFILAKNKKQKITKLHSYTN